MKVYNNNYLILLGYRFQHSDCLCKISLAQSPPTININTVVNTLPPSENQTMNVIIRKDIAAKDLAYYLRTGCF